MVGEASSVFLYTSSDTNHWDSLNLKHNVQDFKQQVVVGFLVWWLVGGVVRFANFFDGFAFILLNWIISGPECGLCPEKSASVSYRHTGPRAEDRVGLWYNRMMDKKHVASLKERVRSMYALRGRVLST